MSIHTRMLCHWFLNLMIALVQGLGDLLWLLSLHENRLRCWVLLSIGHQNLCLILLLLKDFLLFNIFLQLSKFPLLRLELTINLLELVIFWLRASQGSWDVYWVVIVCLYLWIAEGWIFFNLDPICLSEISVLDLLAPLGCLLLHLDASGNLRLDMMEVIPSTFSYFSLMNCSNLDKLNALHDDLCLLEFFYIILSYSFLLLEFLNGSLIVISN